MTNFVISGEAGQGIESASEILSKILHHSHFHVYTSIEYMSRVRGGCNSTLIKVTSEAEPYYSDRIDYLFILDEKAHGHLKNRVSEKTIVVDAQKSNMYATGYILTLVGIECQDAIDFIKEDYRKIFENEKNIQAFLKACEDAKNSGSSLGIQNDQNLAARKLYNGNRSLALGSVAGGANFISFYPMSPSTEYSTILSNFDDSFNIFSEQAEDEIAAINMALGASYAGARACVSTSGGGFALMCEGVSLCGMLDLPLVIHLAQRPGPATGLPTRTAQEDLNLALYSGHGEFERIIYSPANIQDSFEIAQMAYEQAQKFRVPVFILSEQALLEAGCAIDVPEAEENSEYQSLIPSKSEALVCVDSDEHDEAGYITEDLGLRVKMVDKRLSKRALLEHDLLPPYFEGEVGYEKLIVSWGSNFEVLKAAIKERNDFALLHYRQLYPLGEEILNYSRGKRLVIVEQNATCQLGKLIMREFGIEADYKFLKYNGMPISIEEIGEFLNEIR